MSPARIELLELLDARLVAEPSRTALLAVDLHAGHEAHAVVERRLLRVLQADEELVCTAPGTYRILLRSTTPARRGVVAAHRVRDLLRAPCPVAGRRIAARASTGFAIARGSGTTAHGMLERAESDAADAFVRRCVI